MFEINVVFFSDHILLVVKLCFHLRAVCSLCFAANEEYYQMLMINDSQPPGFDVSSYTIEEINSITSEYTLKNTVKTFNIYITIKILEVIFLN